MPRALFGDYLSTIVTDEEFDHAVLGSRRHRNPSIPSWLYDYEDREVALSRRICAEQESADLINIRDFFPDLKLKPPFCDRLPGVPIWVLLPFYNQIIVWLEPVRSAAAFTRLYGVAPEGRAIWKPAREALEALDHAVSTSNSSLVLRDRDRLKGVWTEVGSEVRRSGALRKRVAWAGSAIGIAGAAGSAFLPQLPGLVTSLIASVATLSIFDIDAVYAIPPASLSRTRGASRLSALSPRVGLSITSTHHYG